MRRFALTPSCTAIIRQGDLTTVEVDAIVNAANERMLGGGGVDGAIHRRAGPRLLDACRALPEVRPGVRCPTGDARITPGFDLPARWVIHTVGPVYQSAETSAPLLASAYGSSLRLANAKGLGSIAFPAVSCGVFGYPIEDAAGVALSACIEHAGRIERIHFVLFAGADYAAWVGVAESRLEPLA